MDNTKNPLASLGVWGSLFGILLGLLPFIDSALGYKVDDTVMAIGVAIAGIVALIGRLRATHVLKF